MSKEIIDFVNKENLIWCRKKAALDISNVYKKTGWSADTGKIEKWEEGLAFPTISELKQLGKVYKKAWTLFLLDKNLAEVGFDVMKDFRGSIDIANKNERQEIVSFANEMESRQGFMTEFASVLEIRANPFFGSLHGFSDPALIAEEILKNLHIEMSEVWEEKTRSAAINLLQKKLGEHKILVSFSSTHAKKQISVDTMRGMLLRSATVPVIGLNSAEKSKGAQIFSIFHELTHLAIEPVRENEVFVEKISFRDTKAKSPTERLCDQVAAFILIPDLVLDGLRGRILTAEVITEQCKRLKINVDPFLYRAVAYGLIDNSEVDFLRRECKDDEIVKKLPNGGGPDGGLLQINKNGKYFISTVNTLYHEGQISFAQALGVLEVKAAAFSKYANT